MSQYVLSLMVPRVIFALWKKQNRFYHRLIEPPSPFLRSYHLSNDFCPVECRRQFFEASSSQLTFVLLQLLLTLGKLLSDTQLTHFLLYVLCPIVEMADFRRYFFSWDQCLSAIPEVSWYSFSLGYFNNSVWNAFTVPDSFNMR